MSSKKLTSRQSLSGASLKKFRSDVAKLKAKGLVGKRVDARSQKPTRYMKSQIKRFENVLSGKAQVIHAPKARQAKNFSDRYDVKGKSIVVPTRKNERVSFSAKNEAIITRRTVKGRTIKRETFSTTAQQRLKESESAFDARMRKLEKRGKMFRIEFGGGQSWTIDNWDDVLLFMQPYEEKEKNPFKNWRRYIQIVDDGDDD